MPIEDETEQTDQHESTPSDALQRREVLGAVAAVAGSGLAPGVASADHGDDVVAEMSLSEKVQMTHGDSPGSYVTGALESPGYGIPTVQLFDGPMGVRSDRPQTAFPASILAAATFDTELAREQGVVMGRETKAADGHHLLGPALNVHRTPKCGRTFEYYSEDPYLTGEVAASTVEGVQSEGVVATPKHFVANSQEHERRILSSEVSERALREIYFPGFRKAIQDGGALSIMSAYNAVDGENCTSNEWLLTDVLRDEWGFEGYVVTDWGAIEDTVAAATAGTDVDMDGSRNLSLFPFELESAVRNGQVPESRLEEMVGNVLHAYGEAGHLDGDVGSGRENTDEHQQLSREIAESGAVLMKNDDVLPIDLDAVDSIAVVGSTADEAIVGGTGAADVTPPYSVSAREAIEDHVGGRVQVVTDASQADVAVAFGHVHSGEFEDRADLSLDDGDRAIQQAADQNEDTVAVLRVPGPVEMPWLDDVAGVLNVFYPGMEDGTATANLLFGETNPSGKLPTTFAREEQYPANVVENFGGSYEVDFEEGIYVGYRYFDAEDVEPTFEFGHGLSYTAFEYANLQHPDVVDVGETATVSVDVTNTGDRAGAEAVQFYVEQIDPSVERPPKELKGFDKVHVEPGETATATVDLGREAFRFWDPASEEWIVEQDEFRVHAAASSRDVRESGSIGVGVSTPGPCADAAGGSTTVDGQMVCDVDGNGKYRDVTGDGSVGQGDVAEFFSKQHRSEWKQPELFDFSGNGAVTHGDVVELADYVALH